MAETMTKKWNRAPLAPERVEEMERYLNKMSHEGWQCCEIVRDELRFVRGEQDEYTYRVQYFYESRDGEKDDYLRTLGETGAALVGEYDNDKCCYLQYMVKKCKLKNDLICL